MEKFTGLFQTVSCSGSCVKPNPCCQSLLLVMKIVSCFITVSTEEILNAFLALVSLSEQAVRNKIRTMNIWDFILLQPTHKYMNKSKFVKIQSIENQFQLVRVSVGLGAFMNKAINQDLPSFIWSK